MTTQHPTLTEPWQGERRLAVLLFADLSGYTTLCRTLDPEDVAATVLPLLADVRSTVIAEGGIATGVAGDGFLAVFGVPLSHTDIADRAVRCALEMRRIVRLRSAQHTSLPVPDIHIGITAGEVLSFPSDDPSGLSFIGPAINLAARLSDAAPAGTILVDDHLRRLLTDKSAVTMSRELVVQGHEDGVRVWELSTGTPTLTPSTALPFVGREDLLRMLDVAWEAAQRPEGRRLLPVLGEAGIGKTTLLREWLRRGSATQSVWLNCHDAPFGTHVDGLVRQLQALAGLEPPRARETTTPTMTSLLATPAQVGSSRAREVLQLVQGLGSAGVAIVLDDFQNADDELRAVAEEVAGSRAPIPFVIVCASRRDDVIELTDDSALVVPPLGDQAVVTLVNAALGAPAPEPVARALVSRAEGRPLAALQSSAYLVETGAIAVQGTRCIVLESQQLSDLPDTMRLFVAGRLDRLPPGEKQAIQELSAVGSAVRVDLVERLFGGSRTDMLDSLVARGFLLRTDSTVAFSHGVVHEVAYASLPRALRARLHRRIVEEDATGDGALRALHARQWASSTSESSPGDRRLAVAAALRHTLDHARSMFAVHVRNAYAEARSVRALLDEGVPVAPTEVAHLLVLMAGCDIHGGRYDDAVAGASRAVQVCNDHAVDTGVLIAALCVQGEALSQLRHYQSARQVLDEALHIADASHDRIGRARALRLMGETYRHTDSSRLLALTEEAFDILAACGDEVGAAEAARTMAYWLSVSTTPRLQRWIEEAERRTPIDAVRGRLELARTRAYAAGARLDYVTAREQARFCRDFGRELGVGEVTTDGLMIGVESAAALGLLAESVALLGELEKFATRRGEPRLRQMVAVVGLLPLQRAGALDRARDAMAQATALRDAFGPPETTMAATALGLAARDRGAWELAVDQLEVALAAADECGFGLLTLVLRQELMLTSALLGVASPDARDIAELAEAGGAPALASLTRAAMDLLGEPLHVCEPPAGVLEAAVRADAQALAHERRGADAAEAWRQAAAAWQSLGLTVFLARAQARSGAAGEAKLTLEAVDASAEGRDWAFQR